jgi:transcriptional regulator with XRE-family HTH domain
MDDDRARRCDELIARREHAGWTQEALAEALGTSSGTISSWERGLRRPGPRFRKPLARELGINLVELDRLLDPARPPTLNGHRVPRWLSHYESLCLAAGRLQTFEYYVFHGLLQTAAYATAIERTGRVPLSDEQVAERVEVRLARQKALVHDPDPLQLTAVIPEGVLREVIGGPQVMAGQLDHLLAMAERPNVELRVVPCDGRAAFAINSFELLSKPGDIDPFMAVTADIGGARYWEDPPLVERFDATFARLVDIALPGQHSLARIEQIREIYR